jgi:hypothetical protein
MKTRTFSLVAVLAVAVASGCASSSTGASASQQSSVPAKQRGSRDRITADELAGLDVQNALQAVQRLRPSFLQSRGGASSSMSQGPQDVVVYVDQTRMGGPNTLADIPISEVKEIQWLNGNDATQRFGTNHGSGAIIVIRK